MAESHKNENILQDQWGQVCGQIKTEIGDAAFESWLKPMTVGSLDGEKLSLCVPTRFMRNWVITHYSDRIRALWCKFNPQIKDIEFLVRPGQAPKPRKEKFDSSNIENSLVGNMPVPRPEPINSSNLYPAKNKFINRPDSFYDNDSNDGISVPLNPKFTFDNFIIGKSNEFAYAAARRVAESDDIAFNPLFLYSGVGLGKTHLMHAIAWHIKERSPNRTVLCLSAEKFMYKFVKSIRYKDTVSFKEMFRSVDVLMIDDVQFICNKDVTQEEFFHTFNSLIEQGRQIIISADKSPTNLMGIESRLKSRLSSGLVADIHPTNYELRLGILQAKAEQLGVKVPVQVLEFLAHKITSNVRELEGALQRVVAHSQLLVGRTINLLMAQDVLKDLLNAYDRNVTIDEIQRKVAEHFNISIREMHSARRARSVARPRQVAMYLAKQLTSRSLPEIGRKFGRDHTTIMHAIRKIEEICNSDRAFAEDVDLLRRMLGQ
ncbi:MAG: chromosomal replication initiator protein DnaA [Alphaproteobacteria bacterium]